MTVAQSSRFSSQIMLKNTDLQPKTGQNQSRNNPHMASRNEKSQPDPISNVVVTDWTEKLKDEISQNHLATTTSPDEMFRTTSRL